MRSDFFFNNGTFLGVCLMFNPPLALLQNNKQVGKCHEEFFLSLQPMIPPKCFDIFPPNDWGMLRRSRCVQIFL